MRLPHEILTARRLEKGLSVRQVWQAVERKGLRISESAVGHYFSGKRERPRDMKVLKAICKELELTVGEVMADEPSTAVTGLEEVLLRQFRDLSDEQQEALLVVMKTMGGSK